MNAEVQTSRGVRQHERRTLVLCDVDNLLPCEPKLAVEADYEHTVTRFVAEVDLRQTDQVVVGVSSRPTAAFGVRRAWPCSVLRVRRGLDGADQALTDEVIDLRDVARRHDTVVIGSGDHYFVPTVVALNEVGIRTVVVSRPECLSRELASVAQEVRLLTDVTNDQFVVVA